MGPEASSQRQSYRGETRGTRQSYRDENRGARREQTTLRPSDAAYSTPAQVPTPASLPTPAPPPLPTTGLILPPRTPPPNSSIENTVYVTNPQTAVGGMDQLALPSTPQADYSSYPGYSPCQPSTSSSATSSKLSDPNAYGIDDPNYVDRYRVINGVRLALPRRKSELPTSAEVFRSFRYYIPGLLYYPYPNH